MNDQRFDRITRLLEDDSLELEQVERVLEILGEHDWGGMKDWAINNALVDASEFEEEVTRRFREDGSEIILCDSPRALGRVADKLDAKDLRVYAIGAPDEEPPSERGYLWVQVWENDLRRFADAS